MYASQAFQTSDNESVGAGSIDSDNYVKQVSCTYSAGVTTIASFATTNRLDSNVVTASRQILSSYTLALYTAKGKRCAIVYSGILIPDTAASSPVTWTYLYNYSTAPPQPYRHKYYDTTEIDTMLNGLSLAPDATDVIKGKSRLSFLQSSLTDPIAVGQNDPIWRAAQKPVYLETYGHTQTGLNNAITAIGSTQTTLIVSSQVIISSNTTIPANILVVLTGNGSFSVNVSRTLTISSFGPCAPYQVFSGAGSTVFAKNATGGVFRIEWWAGISNSATLTNEFAQARTSLVNNQGGILDLGPGVWKTLNFQIPDFTTIRGVGKSGDSGEGTTLRISNTGSSGAAVLKVFQAYRYITVQDLTVDASTSAVGYAVLISGIAVDGAGFGLRFERVRFTGTGVGALLTYVKDGGGGWQSSQTVFDQCQWDVPTDGIGLQIETPNSLIQISEGLFAMGPNSTAVEGTSLGFFRVVQTEFAGVGLSALEFGTTLDRTITQASIASGTKDLTISTGAFTRNDLGRRVVILGKLDSYIDRVDSATAAHVHDNATVTATNAAMNVLKWTENTARAHCAIHVVGGHGPIILENCADEGLTYSVINEPPYAAAPIVIQDSWLQGWVQLNQACNLVLKNNHLWSQIVRTGAGGTSHIFTDGNSVVPQCVQIGTGNVQPVLLEPDINGEQLGVALYHTGFNYKEGLYRQDLRFPTDIIFGGEWAAGPDENNPAFSIGSTVDVAGGIAKVLDRVGVRDPVSEAWLYYYERWRDSTTGFLRTRASQAEPFRGYQWDASLRAPNFIGGQVSPAAITTDAGTFLSLTTDRFIRATLDADHTIAGFVPAGPTGETAEFWIVNIHATFKLTLLHQNAGATATTRFLCDTGANIVLWPNEIAHLQYDSTTARWRTSRLGITGLTSDGATVTSALPVVVGSSLVINGGSALDTSSYTGSGDLVRKGAPTLVTPNIGVATGNSLTTSGLIKSTGTTGVGYGAGAGGSISQGSGSGKATACTLSKTCGAITTDNASLAAATIVSFVLTNTTIAATDVLILNHISGGTVGSYTLNAQCAAGSATINIRNNTAGALAEALVIQFAVVKAVIT